MSEKQIEKFIRILRTDGGGEYVSSEFDSFCSKNEILHVVTAPYTPQQNRLANRRNRTLMNMDRAILKEKGLPQSLW
jgi:transposase InsO family protein